MSIKITDFECDEDINLHFEVHAPGDATYGGLVIDLGLCELLLSLPMGDVVALLTELRDRGCAARDEIISR